MAKEYDNTNRGVVFPNDKKKTPNHPDFKGNCTVKTPDGELIEYWVSGWEKEGRSGPMLSLSFTLKDGDAEREEKPAAKTSSLFGKAKAVEPPAKPAAKKSTIDEDLDDSVPF